MEHRPGTVTVGDSRRVGPGVLDGPTIVLFVFAVVLAGAVCLLDLFTNPSVSASALYSLVIFYCWLFQGSAPVVGVATVCSGLAIADVFVGKSPSDDVAG